MSYVVSLLGFEPPARYDVPPVPWATVAVQEAPSPSGPWTQIDLQALTPLDPDPTAPAVRNVTTANATLVVGWYRLIFFDGGGAQSTPSDPVRNSAGESQLPPTPDDVRNESPLLRLKFPLPPASPFAFADLRNIVYQATALVQSVTWRIIDPTLGCAAPEDYQCELVSDPLVPVAFQAIARMAERIYVTTEPEFAEQIATGRRLRGFSAGPYCVPMDTEALTDRGWRSYGDLRVGDLVMGYDREAGVARWTPITNIVAPVEADLVRIGPKRFGLRCTPNHRWLVRERPTGHRYRPGAWGDWELREARDLVGRKDFDLMLSAPAETEHGLDITPAEAALIAWLWTDGHIKQRGDVPIVAQPRLADGMTCCATCGAAITYRGRGMPRRFCDGCKPTRRLLTKPPVISGVIYQKHYRERVEDVLADACAPHTVTIDACDADYARYQLRSPWLRDLWERATLDALSPVEFVLSLGTEAREAFLEAGLWAEGHLPHAASKRPERSPGGRWYRWQFVQNEGPVLDAFVLAAHLCGYGARVWRSLARCKGFLLGRAVHSGQSVRVVPDGREMVWCVQTELGSWTIRQGNTIALTGNSEQYFAPGEFARRGAQQGRAPMDQDDALDAALWALATEDARDYFIWRATGVAPPVGQATSFDYRRQSIGYGMAGAIMPGAHGGPDGF